MIHWPNEWRMVPVEATEEMCADGGTHCASGGMLGDPKTARLIYQQMLAAAPAPPVVEVTDEVAKRVNDEWDRLVMRRDCSPDAAYGYDMIAAVQSVLGPALGMVTREEMAREVEAAYRECASELCHYDAALVDKWWAESAARKRLEGGR